MNTNHGGARPGAGHPLEVRRIKLGQQFICNVFDPTGKVAQMPQLATVVTITRTAIRLRLESGEEILLGY